MLPAAIAGSAFQPTYILGALLAAIAAISGRSLAAPTGDRRPGDPPQLVADVTRARDELGFTASYETVPGVGVIATLARAAS